jgi:hypothetical protein
MENSEQLELFLGKEEDSKSASPKRSNPLIAGIRKSERILVTVVVFALSSIISFSLGVEKGKRLALTKGPVAASFDLAAAKTRHPTAQASAPAVTSAVPSPEVTAVIQGYTIQLASYKSLSSAQIEAQALKKKGLTPIILTKSGYKVLCVGRFNNKETAQQLLSELSKRYEGCRIRRL